MRIGQEQQLGHYCAIAFRGCPWQVVGLNTCSGITREVCRVDSNTHAKSTGTKSAAHIDPAPLDEESKQALEREKTMLL